MAYDVSVLNLGLRGEISCEEQHALYKSEYARLSALAKQLGPVAAECHQQHGRYDSLSAAYEETVRKNAACRDAIFIYNEALRVRKIAQEELAACNAAKAAQASALEKYNEALKAYKQWVTTSTATNAARTADYEVAVASTNTKNYAISQSNKGLEIGYAQRLATWQKQLDAYQLWGRNVAGQMRSGEEHFQRQTQQYPVLKDYDFQYRTYRCGAHMRCMPEKIRNALLNSCAVVKGLGVTYPKGKADDCLVSRYYQVCPAECPPAAADPGAKPAPPTLLPYLQAPKPPDLIIIVSLDDFLRKFGVEKPGPLPLCSPVVPPAPKDPACTVDILPSVPPKPTCTPPEIPAMPVEPTCQLSESKPRVFGQVGTMWLLLAAGGAGLYWYSKKK